jgi:hypothetical protein
VQLVVTHEQLFRLANINFPVSASNQKQFRSSGKKLRRPAFVGLNMGALMADDTAKWLTHLRERQRIRRGAGENKINVAISFEDFTDPIAYLLCPPILAVGRSVIRICFLQHGPSLGANRRCVIARKFVALYNHHPVATRVSAPNQSAQKEIA